MSLYYQITSRTFCVLKSLKLLWLTASDLIFSGQHVAFWALKILHSVYWELIVHGRQGPVSGHTVPRVFKVQWVKFASEASGPQKTKKSVSEEISNFLDVG